jgi:hypothetical protein
MSCTKCGSRTTRSRLCRQCALDERYTPARDDTSQPAVTYECTGCGAHYRSDDSDECPECESQRRRYAGDLAPDGGTVKACPECKSSDIFPTPGGIVSTPETDWRCDDCDAQFNEPAERAPDKNSGGHTSAPGQKLLNADPDEVLSDGGEGRTRVGHCVHNDTDVYVGRGPGGRGLNTTDTNQRGWLGNPYPLSESESRAASIQQFRRDFEARLRDDDAFRQAVRNLAGKTLGCWCQRLSEDEPACHAEVIAEHVERLRAAEDEDDQEGDGDEGTEKEPVPDGGQPASDTESEKKTWQEYQQTEIDEAKEEIEDRIEHIGGRVQQGILDGVMLDQPHNDRFQAYLEGYIDALRYSKSRVERIRNLVKYAESAADADDDEPHRLAGAEPRTQPSDNGGDGQ